MELHRTNNNSCEAQNITEQSTHDCKHTVKFPEFFQSENRRNKFDNLKPHISKLKYTESYKVFMGLKFLQEPYL